MGCRLHRPHEVGDVVEGVGMRIEVQKARLLTTGQIAATERLENASGDRMVTADGHRPQPAASSRA